MCEDCTLECPANSDAPEGSNAESDCLCNAGFTGPNGGPCVECIAGKYKAEGGDGPCTECLSGYFSGAPGQTSQTSCEMCPYNSIAPAGSTAVTACGCNAGYTGPNGGTCSACVAGKYKDDVGSNACRNCAAGKYAPVEATTECVVCPSNSNSLPGSTAVTACGCNAGYTGPNGGTCSACVAGKYKDDVGSNACKNCAAGKYAPGEATTECVVCPSNSNSLPGSTATSACKCNMGFTGPNGGTCSACVAGKYKDDVGSNACRNCAAGKYQAAPGNVACERCGAGKYKAGSGINTACDNCEAGKYKAKEGVNTACDNCAAGKYKATEGVNTACDNCAAGKYNAQAGVNTACDNCAAGKYKATAGVNVACDNCPAGTYSTTIGASTPSFCLDCPSDTTSSAGSDASADCISLCAAGWTGLPGSCVQCPIGTYKPEAGGGSCLSCPVNAYSTKPGQPSCMCNAGYTGVAMACNACVAGTYKEQPGSEECTKCEGGKYSNRIGAVSQEECVTCPSGTYSTPSNEACASCPAHSTSPVGSDQILDCECNMGFSVDIFSVSNDLECIACMEGTYKAAPGDEPCLACPWASTSAVASWRSLDCKCTPGFTGSDGAACTACEAGKYKVSIGSDDCTACGSGKFSATVGATSDVCQACPDNSDAPQASNELTDCRCLSGYAGLDGGTCIACVAGKYKIYTGSDACSDCANGKYSSYSGAMSEVACVECPENTDAPQGSNELTDCQCKSGYTGPDGVACTACEAGKYKTDVNSGSLPCTNCGAGKYSTTVGAKSVFSCLACPANSFAPAGSAAASACVCNAGFTGPNGDTCVVCVAGKYKAAMGDDACTDCAAGKFSSLRGGTSEHACSLCPGDTVSAQGSDSADDCRPEFFLTKNIVHDNPYPCDLNCLTVTFQTNVMLVSGQSEITIRNLMGAMSPTGLIEIQGPDKHKFNRGIWMQSSSSKELVLYLAEDIPMNTQIVITFCVYNPAKPQNDPDIEICATAVGNLPGRAIPCSRMDKHAPSDYISYPLRVKKSYFDVTIGQTTSLPCTANTLTITLIPTVPLLDRCAPCVSISGLNPLDYPYDTEGNKLVGDSQNVKVYRDAVWSTSNYRYEDGAGNAATSVSSTKVTFKARDTSNSCSDTRGVLQFCMRGVHAEREFVPSVSDTESSMKAQFRAAMTVHITNKNRPSQSYLAIDVDLFFAPTTNIIWNSELGKYTTSATSFPGYVVTGSSAVTSSAAAAPLSIEQVWFDANISVAPMIHGVDRSRSNFRWTPSTVHPGAEETITVRLKPSTTISKMCAADHVSIVLSGFTSSGPIFEPRRSAVGAIENKMDILWEVDTSGNLPISDLVFTESTGTLVLPVSQVASNSCAPPARNGLCSTQVYSITFTRKILENSGDKRAMVYAQTDSTMCSGQNVGSLHVDSLLQDYQLPGTSSEQ
jgi:hypothetical protein